jgi:hypothetical protein
MASDDQKPSGFKVNDRRSFTGGTTVGEVSPPETPSADGAARPAPSSSAGTTGLPAVDFHTFVLSLGSSALLHLGELEAPGSEGPQKDLALAKHTIDLLVMLEEKTRGNLTPAEEKLITSLLYDLRLRYVEATQAK